MNITCNTNERNINEYNITFEHAEKPYEQIGLRLLAEKLKIENEDDIKELKERMVLNKLDYFQPYWTELNFKKEFMHEWFEEDLQWVPIDPDEYEQEWRDEIIKIVDEHRCYDMKEKELNEWIEGYGISEITFFTYQETSPGGWKTNPVAYAAFLYC